MNQTVPNSQAAARAAGFDFRPKDSATFDKEPKDAAIEGHRSLEIGHAKHYVIDACDYKRWHRR